MKHLVAKIHPADNVLVALTDLPIGPPVTWDGGSVTTTEKIPAKRKLALQALAPGDEVTIYGVLVGCMAAGVGPGGLLTTATIRHATDAYQQGQPPTPGPGPTYASSRGAPSWASTSPMGGWARPTTGWLSRWFSARTATSRC